MKTNMDLKNTLGPTLKALRKSRRLTQQEIALAVGLERTSICNIELQRQAVTDMLVTRWAEKCGCQVIVKFKRL